MHDRDIASRSLPTDLALGAAAGAAATFGMDRLTTVLYEREPKAAQERENAARGQKTAYEIAAEKGAKLAGRSLDEEQRKRLAGALHWSIGVGAGVLYGLLRRRTRLLSWPGSGLAYATAFWLLVDEGALTALGLTPPPPEFPWQTHARGLAGHLALGAGLEAAFQAADRLA